MLNLTHKPFRSFNFSSASEALGIFVSVRLKYFTHCHMVGANIHASLRMNLTDFADSLTLHVLIEISQ